MSRLALLPLLLLAACSDSRSVMEELPNSSIAGAPREDVAESRMEEAIARPVTIGEDGPRFAACGSWGVIRGLGAGISLDMRAAPFQEAKVVAKLGNGARLHVCTRSLDQRWLGVVVARGAEAPEAETSANASVADDCGVSSPVEAKRPYTGPCDSGWVSSALVQLIAD